MSIRGFRLKTRQRLAQPVMVGAAIALGTLGLPSSAGAALAPSMIRPVLLVHGFSLSSSVDCSSTWSQDISWLQSEGFTGPFVKVGYYSGDSNCDVNLHNYGSYGDQDSWKSIAAAFSHYVYDNYTSRGVAVQAIGYSMGGLVVRGAIYGAQSGASGFSVPINISDVTSWGSPYNGAAWYAQFCFWSTQCQSMVQGSSDLDWLNQNGDPQGSAGTNWTVMGSNNDDVVPASSAVDMSVPANNSIVWDNISHTGVCCHPSYLQSWDVLNRTAAALGTSPSAIHSGINSAKCVDDYHSGTSEGNPVDIYDCNGTGAQVWAHTYNGVTVLSVLGKCLDVTEK
jgi:hypothetical protein